MLVDIINRDNNPNDDDVIINTIVRNNGEAFQEDFVVWCTLSCSGNEMGFSGMTVSSGMNAGQEMTLGGNSLLYLGSCSFATRRDFTCRVDSDNVVRESNENNNTLTENILTGR